MNAVTERYWTITSTEHRPNYPCVVMIINAVMFLNADPPTGFVTSDQSSLLPAVPNPALDTLNKPRTLNAPAHGKVEYIF